MQALASFLVRRAAAWTTVAVVLLLSIASLFFASRVERDDDLLAFLPRKNPDVGVFYDVSKRFGSLDVALVGIASEDVLAPDFLTRLRTLTKKLNETEGIGYALSLANVEDFTTDAVHGGISTDYLIGQIPQTPEEQKALREKVLSRDQIVGNLIAPDGKAALLYCFAGYGTEPKTVAAKVRNAVEEAFPAEKKYWGGAPFISTYIYELTQADMRKLAPWAVLVIVFITILSFRDVIGAGLALLSTAIGIVMSLGVMGALGVSVNVVLGSLPVILFALGSAYPVHILSRYYAIAYSEERKQAIVRTLAEVGPPVLASGLTTVAGLLSFLLMDIAPLRTFGIFTALGILITLILALTFVPAVIFLVRLKGKPPEKVGEARFHVWLGTLPQRRRAIVGPVLAGLALVSAFFVSRVDSRMDNAAFFSKNSPPDQAETFLREHFGGSLFVQIQIEGDMTDPVVLREVRMLADQIALLGHVSSVNHIGNVVAQINEAMEGDRRIPDSSAKVKLLYGFLEGKKIVAQLVTDDRKTALMQIKLDTNLAAETEPLLVEIKKIAATGIAAQYVVSDRGGPRKEEAQKHLRASVSNRIAAIGKQFDVKLKALADIDTEISAMGKVDAKDALKEALLRFLGSEECSVELSGAEQREKVALALSALGENVAAEELTATLATALEKPKDDTLVTDLADTVDRPLEEMRRRAVATAQAKKLVQSLTPSLPEGDKGSRLISAVAAGLLDLDAPQTALSPAASEKGETLAVAVTGLPVMHAGLSRSVESNQWKSLFFALGLVLLIMAGLFRSVLSGLLGILPIMLTMAVIYGGMGILGVRLDIGTSMLASLIIGAGVDYAVHLMVAWNAEDKEPLSVSATNAARHTGPAIWVNALMVAAGFFVLTLGDARPLQNVGGLTAAAMITAALATLLVIPLLAKKSRYYIGGRIPTASQTSQASGSALPTSAPSLTERGSR